MARKRSVPLTEAEQRLMEIVWKREAVTVSAVVDALSPEAPLAYTSVQTMMKILEQKGYVRHREVGRAFLYSAVVDRRSAARTALTYVMQRFFGGSPERLALNLVEDEGLTLEQLENIRALIDVREKRAVTAAGVVVALVNSAWQGLALVGVVALALRASRRANAASTCAVWSATFVVVALLPILDLALQRTVVAGSIAVASSASRGPLQNAADHFVAAGSQAVALQELFRTVAAALSSAADRFGMVLLAAWGSVAATLLALLARNGLALLRLKRHAKPLEDPVLVAAVANLRLRRRVRICSSDRIAVPCAAGFLHPMVLVPTSLVDSLAPDDLMRVILHEVGHLERFDDWTNAVERAVRAVFFFQPALSIAAARIDLERELACDDRVLEKLGEAVGYAECLARIVERQLRFRAVARVLGFFIGRSQVAARIARLVDRRRNGSVRTARAITVAVAGLVLAAGGMATIQVPLVARSVPPQVPQATRVAAVHSHAATRAHQHTVAATPHRIPRKAIAGPVVVPNTPAAAPKHAERVAAAFAEHVATRTTVSVVTHRRYRERHETVVAYSGDATSQRGPAAPSQDDQASGGSADAAPATPPQPRDNAELADALSRTGYRASDEQVQQIADNGLTAGLLQAFVSTGIHMPNLRTLLGTCEKGVDRGYVQAVAHYFSGAASFTDVLTMHDEGVAASYLDALAAEGFAHLSVHDVIALDQNGVSPSYIAELMAAGYAHLTPHELIELRSEGVDSGFLQTLADHGYHGLSPAEVVRLHGKGIDG